MGLCEDYPEESRTLEAAQRDLERTVEAGSRILRMGIGWDAIEPAPGTYDWSFWDEFMPLAVERYGVRLIPYVSYTPEWAATDPGPDYWRSPPADPEDFGRFMEAIATRYARWVDVWELWNEPDNAEYWSGNTTQFAELTRAGSAGVRRANPQATVVLGGLAWDLEYLRELLAEHEVAPAVDAINIHSYFETWHEHPIEQLANYVEEAAAIIHAVGEGEPLWMAEVGYSSRGIRPGVREFYRSRYREEHTADYQASALARTLLVSLATGRLSLLAWFRINDLPAEQEVIGDDRNRYLGLFDVEGQPKPAWPVFGWLSEQFAGPYRVLAGEAIAVDEGGGERLEMRTFALGGGRRLVAVWMPPGTAPTAVDRLGEDRRQAQVKVTLPHWRGQLLEGFRAPGGRVDPAAIELNSRGEVTGTTLRFGVRGSDVMMILLAPPSGAK
jgi:polysaccharide biosynthesis protein PslG